MTILPPARHLRDTLAPDGSLMIVEPLAGDRLEDNLNPVGQLYYASSTMIRTPASLAQEVGLGLGAQAGERKLGAVLTSAGFGQVRRATETPFNMVRQPSFSPARPGRQIATLTSSESRAQRRAQRP